MAETKQEELTPEGLEVFKLCKNLHYDSLHINLDDILTGQDFTSINYLIRKINNQVKEAKQV